MVVIAAGPHLFPSRTQQLSPLTPMVLHGRLCGRVGSRRRKSLFALAEIYYNGRVFYIQDRSD